MTFLRRGLAAAVIPVAIVVLAAGPAAAAPSPLPNTMASLGDSIPRGFNACGWYVDCTSRSFSTGDSTSVNSHYLRIRAVNGAIGGHNYNDSRSGAKASDLAGQAVAAAGHGVSIQYVTVLIGANDACTSSEMTMTPVTVFRSGIDLGLGAIKSALGNPAVVVISIPDIKRLWEVGRGSFAARTAWSRFGVCQSMLANPTSNNQADVDRRDRVRQRVIDFNGQLAAACAAYGSKCRYDHDVFTYPFTLSHVSGWDYFHPNTNGQAVLAQLTY